MQYQLLDILKCPLSKTSLRFELIAEFDKTYGDQTIKEIKDGLLYSETGFVFPVINGIPRLLVESVYDYAGFLQQHLPRYEHIKNELKSNYKGVLTHCIKKNKKTKQSFELEWSFLDPTEKDKIWRDDSSSMPEIFLKETGEEQSFYAGKKVIDVGCGHGIMTSKIATMSSLAVGVELSKAVEHAYSKNQQPNAWYLQADLQFLPLKNQGLYGDDVAQLVAWAQPAPKDPRPGAKYSLYVPSNAYGQDTLPVTGETRYVGLEQFANRVDPKQTWGVTFDGFLNAPVDAIYEFQIDSTNDLQLTIDGQTLIDQAGTKDRTTVSALVPLRAGSHKISLHYDHREGEPVWRVRWAIKGQNWRGLELVH